MAMKLIAYLLYHADRDKDLTQTAAIARKFTLPEEPTLTTIWLVLLGLTRVTTLARSTFFRLG